ncbi:MAG: 3-phosphoserine/phosphohydroxythreonine transaminase [Bacteroidota bacterium]
MFRYSFSAAAGPLPPEVAAEVGEACRAWQGRGSVLTLSFVSDEFRALQGGVESRLRRLLTIPDNYRILFMAGGASAQFALLPLNLLGGRGAAYVETGHWSRRALQEGGRYGPVWSATDLDGLDQPGGWRLDDAAYCHLTSNETADGRQFDAMPELSVPLVADLTSDFLTRAIDFDRLALVYAGTQKSIGVPGLTLVIVRDDLLGQAHPATPRVMDYTAQAAADSRLCTPPVFAIFVLDAMLRWIEGQGGVAAMALAAERRSRALYAAIECSGGFYRPAVEGPNRSRINICFDLADVQESETFIAAAAAAGLFDLRGHPEVGGIRASFYNGTSEAALAALLDFMADFRQAHA